MDLYNTIVTVVANLPAEDGEDAISRLSAALIDHGFDTLTEPGQPPAYADAFVAEDGTEPSDLPPAPHRAPVDYDRLPAAAYRPPAVAFGFEPDEVAALIIVAGKLWAVSGPEYLTAEEHRLGERAFRMPRGRMEG